MEAKATSADATCASSCRLQVVYLQVVVAEIDPFQAPVLDKRLGHVRPPDVSNRVMAQV